jgi:hypothetical protein
MKRTMVSIIVIEVGLFTMILIMFSIPLKVTFINVAMAQAVPLIPLTSGNVTLDTGIPKFYKCIEKEVKGSKAVNDDPYFKSEPTKDEVFKCYYAVFGHSMEKAVN